MTRTFLDVHILQTVPPSCINRDDNGSPKSAVFGGVTRHRVSSQAWKNAVRRDFAQHLDSSELAERTVSAADRIAQRITELAPELDDQAHALAKSLFDAAKIKLSAAKKGDTSLKTGYLFFISRMQIERLARLAVDSVGSTLEKAAVKKAFNEDRSIDLALFGRMVAEDPEFNVDAACQVSHALSVHAAHTEFDFFTAMDDHPDSEETGAGAGMLGTVEFTSSTLYRYATLDVDEFVASLGSVEAAARGASAFVQSFVTSMPTGKQNTFANRTRPSLVLVQVRHDQPVNFVGAFEEPIVSDHGAMPLAAERLLSTMGNEDAGYGTPPSEAYFLVIDSAVGEAATELLTSLGTRCTLPELVEAVGGVVRGAQAE